MKISVRNTENGLIPLYDSDQFSKSKLKLGQDYEIEIHKKRNIYFTKKYFALIKLTWLNLPEKYDELYPNPEVLRKALQVTAGYYDTYYTIDGIQIMEVQSISFDKMDEAQFQEVYNKVLDVILKYILPENTNEEFEQEIFNFL